MDWSSIASCIAHLVSLLSGPKFKYEGITGLTVRVITDKPYHHPVEFYSLRCGIRFRVVPSWITKRITAENARGRIEIYDNQGRLVYGLLSVWIPNHDDFWAFSKTVIGKETHLPVSVDVTGEGTLLVIGVGLNIVPARLALINVDVNDGDFVALVGVSSDALNALAEFARQVYQDLNIDV
jgi:hypothetical protein